MKTNIAGFMRNLMRPGSTEMVSEFLQNLKELRDKPELHSEFFNLYVFSDHDEYEKREKTSPNKANTEVCSNNPCDYCNTGGTCTLRKPCHDQFNGRKLRVSN